VVEQQDHRPLEVRVSELGRRHQQATDEVVGVIGLRLRLVPRHPLIMPREPRRGLIPGPARGLLQISLGLGHVVARLAQGVSGGRFFCLGASQCRRCRPTTLGRRLMAMKGLLQSFLRRPQSPVGRLVSGCGGPRARSECSAPSGERPVPSVVSDDSPKPTNRSGSLRRPRRRTAAFASSATAASRVSSSCLSTWVVNDCPASWAESEAASIRTRINARRRSTSRRRSARSPAFWAWRSSGRGRSGLRCRTASDDRACWPTRPYRRFGQSA